jgi:hypothetical protein
MWNSCTVHILSECWREGKVCIHPISIFLCACEQKWIRLTGEMNTNLVNLSFIWHGSPHNEIKTQRSS